VAPPRCGKTVKPNGDETVETKGIPHTPRSMSLTLQDADFVEYIKRYVKECSKWQPEKGLRKSMEAIG
jgi:hypothetical protein